MHDIYYAHFDDLDHDARSQWLVRSEGGQISVELLPRQPSKQFTKHAQLKSVSHALDFQKRLYGSILVFSPQCTQGKASHRVRRQFVRAYSSVHSVC